MLPNLYQQHYDESLINLIRDRLNDIPAILDKVSSLSADVAAIQVQQQILVDSNERLVTMIEGNGKVGLKDRVSQIEGKVDGIKANCDIEKQQKQTLNLEQTKARLSTKSSLLLAFVTMILNIIVTLITVRISG